MLSQTDLLQKCRAALDKGDLTNLKALAENRDSVSLTDVATHLAWADLLEEAGMVQGVVQELHLALRDDPARRATYERLAEVYLDLGRMDRAAKCWEAWLKQNPRDAAGYRQLGELLRESGDYDAALKTFQTGLKYTKDSSLAALIRELGAAQSGEIIQATEQRGEQILPSQHHLVTFTTLFAGREGIYARQWVSPTGTGGYTPVREPLTLKVAENHILGNHTIGVYPLRMDNTVNFIAIDLDLAKFAVNKTIGSQKAWHQVMQKLHGVACKLVDLGAVNDLPIYLEDSGFKGRHAWIFLQTPVPAGIAKKCGDLLCAQLGTLPSEVMLEVFPKQTKIKPGGLGNLIKLPLGFHKRTGRRSFFLQPDGSPYPDQLGLLEDVVKADRRAVYALIQRLVNQQGVSRDNSRSGQPTTSDTDEDALSTGPSPTTQRELTVVPAAEYDLERDVQVQYLFSKCPVLHSIMQRVNLTGNLSKDETLVLIHTFGHLENGPKAVNDILQRCSNVEPSLLMKSPLRGNPMSCPKIRSRIPQITSAVACNCRFDPTVNLYPTPLIHVYAMQKDPVGHPLGLTLASLQFQNLLQEYLKLRKQAQETAILLKKVEDRLNQVFDDAGVACIQTPLGQLEKTTSEEGGVQFTLSLS